MSNALDLGPSAKAVTVDGTADRQGWENAEPFEALFRYGALGMVISNVQGDISRANDYFCKMLGYDEAELKSMNFSEITQPENLEDEIRAVQAVVRGENERVWIEKRYRHRDGHSVWAAFNPLVLRDRQGQPRQILALVQDITERKETEHALRESETRYRQLFNHAPAGIYEIDFRTGRFVNVNDVMCAYSGYSREEFAHMGTMDILTPESQQQFLERYVKLLADEPVPEGVEYCIRRKNGDLMWVMLIARYLREGGRIVGATVVVHDISQRRHSEEALRHSEERYRNILDSIEEGYFEVDLAGNLTFFNRALSQISGYSPQELRGMNNRQLATPESARRMYQIFSSVHRNGQPVRSLEVECLRKDGRRCVFEISAYLIRDPQGQPIGFRGVTRDVSERKRAEEERRKLESIVATSKDIMLFVDSGYRHQACNESYLLALGRSREEVIGHTLAEVFGPEYFESRLKEKLDRCLEGNEIDYQKWVVFPAIGRRYMVLSGYPFRDEGGKVNGAVLNAHDNTAAKLLEDQLQHAQKMEALGTLAGGVAHNFNNLLMGIQGNASLALLEAGSGQPVQARLESIVKLVQSGSRLTQQLLGYAREGKYEVRAVNLNQVLQETAQTFALTRRDIRVQPELDTRPVDIDADRGQIEQVLLNLFVNAADAMPRGGELRLKTRRVSHQDFSEQRPFHPKPGDYVLLTVADTGIGMDKAVQERIFEPFFTTKEMGKGTGLGLASVYGVVKGHGGYIEVESQKDVGTEFRIYLPAAQRSAELDLESTGHVAAGSGVLLMVDDEEMVLDVSAQLLRRAGFTVHLARSGAEALDFYRANPGQIDLVILDMVMPGLGGGEVFDRLKQIDPQVRVLLSSGYSMEGQAAEILERGCDGFIQKPFDMEQLTRKIRLVLSMPKGVAGP
jgi:PAS domain S-box-containing protein